MVIDPRVEPPTTPVTIDSGLKMVVVVGNPVRRITKTDGTRRYFSRSLNFQAKSKQQHFPIHRQIKINVMHRLWGKAKRRGY